MQRACTKAREGRFVHVKIAEENLEKLLRKELRAVSHSVLRLLLIHGTTERNKVHSCEQHCGKEPLFAEHPVSSECFCSVEEGQERPPRLVQCLGTLSK